MERQNFWPWNNMLRIEVMKMDIWYQMLKDRTVFKYFFQGSTLVGQKQSNDLYSI